MPEQAEPRSASVFDALLPIVTLIGLLAAAVYLFGDDATGGPNQIGLIMATVVAALVALKNGHRWEQIESGMVSGIGVALRAILILLVVGSLIGVWILSGTVPTLIYYGLQILDPGWFYAAACIISAVVALCIGSSWTVAGTVGVALIGTAGGLGLSLEITAGAVISGAYFGDKLSPLSETTNLAPAVAGAELFSHIGNMTWSTVPSLVLAVVGYLLLGLGHGGAGDDTLASTMALLDDLFELGVHLLIPIVVVLILAMRRYPALPVLVVGTVLGALFAVVFQPDLVVALTGGERPVPMALAAGVWRVLADGFQANTGNASLDSLLSRGGMSSMLSTVWLILCAMVFGSVMESTGLLKLLVDRALGLVDSVGSLIALTMASCFGVNVLAADQYMSIVLPGRMYRAEFARRGLAPVNLSRAIEDAGTITSPLIPWNTCGAYMAATLGVATFSYLPYALFNLINPLLALLFVFLGVRIVREEPEACGTGRRALT